MNDFNAHIDDLILKYSRHQLMPVEEEELLHWIEAEPDNRLYFKQMLTIIRSTSVQDVQVDTKKGLNKILGEEPIRKTVFTLTLYRWVASVAFLLLIGSGIFYLRYNSDTDNTFTSVTILSAKDSVTTYHLDDQSNVRLFKNTVLQKPKKFDRNMRSVELHGKAFFEVAKDAKRPFTVKADDVNVKVLGTSFEVLMDKKNITVTVRDGIVLVSSNRSGFSRKITRLQQLVLSTEGQLIAEKLVPESYFSWVKGEYSFDNTPLSDVVDQVARYYDIAFQIRGNRAMNSVLTTKLSKTPLKEFTYIIENSLGLSVCSVKDTVYISDK